MKNIKSLRTLKFVLPMIAVILAVTFAFAFSVKSETAFPKATFSNTYVYEFTGDPTKIAEVTDPSLWIYNATGSDCSDIDQPKACTILVDAAHASTPSLADGSNLTISANNDKGNGSTFRVTQVSDNAYEATPSNQPQ